MFTLVHGFEQRGAQRRRQAHCDHYREHHGTDHSDAELSVNDPCGPAEESHRNEHRAQYDSNANERTTDFFHAALRGLTRA